MKVGLARLVWRSCIACRIREDWADLLHLVLVADVVTPDPDHRLPGRGAWLHPKCFELARTRGSFARAFRLPKGSAVSVDLLTEYLQIKDLK